MKQEQFTTIRLIADDNMFLTQSSDDIDIAERIIGTVVNIGRNDSPDNWCEISAADAEEFERLKAEAAEADIAKNGEGL